MFNENATNYLFSTFSNSDSDPSSATLRVPKWTIYVDYVDYVDYVYYVDYVDYVDYGQQLGIIPPPPPVVKMKHINETYKWNI